MPILKKDFKIKIKINENQVKERKRKMSVRRKTGRSDQFSRRDQFCPRERSEV